MPADDRTIWNAAQEAILVRVLKKAKEEGLQAENGWKPQTFTNIVEALVGTEHESGGLPKAVSHVKSRYHRLKSEYREVKKLREASGFGWDAERQVVTATGDVWEKYLEKHPRAKPWYKKNFPLYDDMADLVDGLVPDGRGAFRPGRGTASGSTTAKSNTSTTVDTSTSESVDTEAGMVNMEAGMATEEGLNDADEDMLDLTDPTTHAADKATNGAARKRAATPDEDSSNPKKKGRQSGAAAIFALSESIENVVTAINATSEGTGSHIPQTSPQRKTAAIRAIEQDEELSDTEMVEVADMIRERMDVADAYLALTKKTTRTAFLQKALDKYKYA